MTTKKPLTDKQKAAKNARARELAAEKKADRASAAKVAETKPELPPEEVKMSCSMIIYDLPANNPAGYADPSATMRRIGFRANLSCWVVPDGAVPFTFIHELRTKYGANVDVVRFDAAEGPRLARMAVTAMQKEMIENQKRAVEGIKLMEERHLAGLDAELVANTEARAAALKTYEGRCARVLKRMNQIIKDVEVAIRNFGSTPEALGTMDARKMHDTLQAGYKEKADAWVRATVALKEIGTVDATAMANAAAKDQVMLEPMVDLLRENGQEDAANDLQKHFAPAHEQDTFSLV